ncbi:hypothetical protein [Streptomyces sp. CAI-85]|uniref:hypothetical protein n=1 Tax=Streptomyces sp. CAI-85 TaxID=1472662 RepID=UPI001586FBFC|nr:hypothetical protein [Streptomyces sp. CAI-85]NUV64293.1 hypothetical protein [Streptomyces sp. CAI-85]
MSQHPGNEYTAPDGAQVIELANFMDDDARARLSADAREAVHLTPAGMADLNTGTLVVEGGIVEQLDDQAHGTGLRTVIPATFRDPAAWQHRRAVARNAAAFHAVRTPRYAYRALRVAAIGAMVATRDAWSYVTAGEYGELADQVRRSKAGAEHIADLRADRSKVAAERRREPVVVYSATGVTSYVSAVAALGEAWSLALAGTAMLPLLLVFYLLGRRELGRRDGGAFTITDVPVMRDTGRTMLGADSVNAAFRQAGLTREGEVIELVGPVRAVSAHASEAVLDLPGDLTLSKVVKEREKLAAAFRVDPSWLDLTGAGHPGRIRVWIASEDPFAAARTSPLLGHPARMDVWSAGIPIGFNRRGEVISLRLRHVMALLGGMSRTGKGMLLRNLICGLGLDPRVNLRLVAGAKPGEHRGYAPVCATFFGRRPERLVALLDAVLAEAYRREDYLEDLGRAKLSEGDLARFPLEVVIIDEFKQYASSSARVPDPSDLTGKKMVKAADRIAEQVEEIAAFAAALNITLLISTQDPDANTVPRGFKSNSGARVCTRTGSPDQTNAILKPGATGAGLRAHEIPEALKGAAIVDIDGAPGELIRGFFVEDEEYDGAAPLISAGVELRAELSRLPGQFEDPIEAQLVEVTGESSIAGGPTGSGRPGALSSAPTDPAGIIADLIAVFAAEGDPERMRTAEILTALADLDPDAWSPEALGVDPEDQAAYVRTGGGELRKAIDDALDGTGRELAARGWSAGGRANGYYLADVRAAAGIAPV